MKLSRQETLALYNQIIPHIEAIEKLFKAPKVTLIVRAAELPDGDLLLTQDDQSDIIASVKKLMARDPAVEREDRKPIDIRHVI